MVGSESLHKKQLMATLWLWFVQELLSGRVEETCTFSQNIQVLKNVWKTWGLTSYVSLKANLRLAYLPFLMKGLGNL